MLEHLLRQKTDNSVLWEVIVVDNASSDSTANVPRAVWPANAAVPLRVIRERRQGLSYARWQGAKAAHGAIVIFLDDDNWVSESWIQRVHDIFALHADVGACGGLGIAVFDGAEPLWFGALKRSYAVGPQSLSAGYIAETRGWLGGAGLCVRRSALIVLLRAGFENLNRGRTGNSLMSGEDVELCLALRLAGCRLYYDPQLVFHHKIAQRRITPSYRRRLHFAFGRAEVALSHYYAVLDRPALGGPPGGARQPLLQEWYWAMRRLIRSLVRPPASKMHWVLYRMNIVQHSGYLWELARSSRTFRVHRKRVSVLAKELRDSYPLSSPSISVAPASLDLEQSLDHP